MPLGPVRHPERKSGQKSNRNREGHITRRRRTIEAGRTPIRRPGKKSGFAAILPGVLLAGCVTGGTGSENYLTIFVDNFEGQAVVVSIGPDTWCQVDARLTRHSCRFGWTGTGNLEVQVNNPSMDRNHVARAARVSSGDRLCLQVRDTGVQLRRC